MAATLVAATTPLGAFAQAPAQPSKVLFRQLKLFDGKSDTARSGVQVLVEDNRIASIDTSNSSITGSYRDRASSRRER